MSASAIIDGVVGSVMWEKVDVIMKWNKVRDDSKLLDDSGKVPK
jgi:hypothetical protein